MHKRTKGLNEQKFHIHCFQRGHSGIEDWKITFIDQVEGNSRYLTQKDSFWQHKVDCFAIGLTEREVLLIS